VRRASAAVQFQKRHSISKQAFNFKQGFESSLGKGVAAGLGSLGRAKLSHCIRVDERQDRPVRLVAVIYHAPSARRRVRYLARQTVKAVIYYSY